MNRCVKCSPHREHSHSKHSPSLRLLTPLSHRRCLHTTWRVCWEERLLVQSQTHLMNQGEAWEPALAASCPGDIRTGGLWTLLSETAPGAVRTGSLAYASSGQRLCGASWCNSQTCHRGDTHAHWPMLNGYFCVLSMLAD